MDPMARQAMMKTIEETSERKRPKLRHVDPRGNPIAEQNKKGRVGTVAFWMKGDTAHENDATHIQVVINDPEMFGITREYINTVYEKHGEKIGVEGQAREEIIKEVTRHGWVRVRHYVGRQGDYWSIQVDHFRRRKLQIEDFIFWALDQEIMYQNDELQIVGFDDNTVMRYTFMDGGVNKYLGEAKNGEERISQNNRLDESSLSRVYAHMQKHATGAISAARYENIACPQVGIEGHVFTRKENQARHRSLHLKLLDKGFGVTVVDGAYIENYGTPDEKEVREPSFFVVDLNDRGDFLEVLREFGEEFEQDSIMYIPKGGETSELWGTQPNVCSTPLPEPNYGEKIVYDHLRMGVEGEFMTKIRNRPFLFEQNELARAKNVYAERSFFGRMGISRAATKHWTEFLED